ncbi:hypothetical protein C8A01DRAFT_32684 [Parachaetomium inaequale]|uniref:DRBM domain-containing protein n=1 Tax=Parachaetomium inaequale TaxID=2588326 RepID=A0AAN6PLE5_9PEZI|nr:hypothetical protein C8A01DRAFT_32684 [Parachaetomium inaequale]
MAHSAQIAVGSSTLDEPVNYRDLKSWIEEQERNPTPLSPLQQRAISDLRRSLEPKVDDRDWVSLLNLYNQAHGGISDFKDHPAADNRWINWCHFELAPDAEQLTFPNPEAGFTINEAGALAAPCFGRKKDAKQYAAKCCIEWLMKGGYMPSDGVSVEFAKGKARPVLPTAKQTPTTNPPPPNQPITTTTVSQPTTTTTTTAHDDDDPPATKRVEDLCRLIGLAIPQYKIAPVDSPSLSGTQFFDGRADFGVDAIKVPDGLGKVANVYGRKNARERVAEEVLVWLVGEERKRVAEAEEMLAQIGG